jgi:glycosyltransferase involved in cell wall biosynthesis
MKIAIVVHGRFHAFHLARALLERGHDVTLFTNYPKWAVERFDFPRDHVRSFSVHGALTRAAQTLNRKKIISYPEEKFHRMFGRWAAKEIQGELWDVVHPWSGVSEEILLSVKGANGLTLFMRGSAHIRTQARLLEEEEHRTGVQQDRPSPWMVARELREYALADRVVVLSSFAYHTFIAEGLPADKLCILPLGARVQFFRPRREIIEARCRRIVAGEPLRVLYVGAVSFQKGMWDLRRVISELDKERFRFCAVGAVLPEVKNMVPEINQVAELVGKRPEQELPEWYARGDLFIFPTIQDGFAVVLSQANASALPILTTTNCSGPDMIREAKTGWVLPIRSPEAFVERLRWCDSHREELAAMVWRTYSEFRPRDWSEVAIDFEKIVTDVRNKPHSGMMLNAV